MDVDVEDSSADTAHKTTRTLHIAVISVPRGSRKPRDPPNPNKRERVGMETGWWWREKNKRDKRKRKSSVKMLVRPSHCQSRAVFLPTTGRSRFAPRIGGERRKQKDPGRGRQFARAASNSPPPPPAGHRCPPTDRASERAIGAIYAAEKRAARRARRDGSAARLQTLASRGAQHCPLRPRIRGSEAERHISALPRTCWRRTDPATVGGWRSRSPPLTSLTSAGIALCRELIGTTPPPQPVPPPSLSVCVRAWW